MWDFYPDRGQAFQAAWGFLFRGGPQGFRQKLAKFYPDSAEAWAKFLVKFYLNIPQDIIGGPGLSSSLLPLGNPRAILRIGPRHLGEDENHEIAFSLLI